MNEGRHFLCALPRKLIPLHFPMFIPLYFTQSFLCLISPQDSISLLAFVLVTYSLLSLAFRCKKCDHHCLVFDSIPLLVMIRENLVELQRLLIPGSRGFL